MMMLSANISFAQLPGSVNEEIKDVIETMFRGMRLGDSTMVSSTFSKGVIMQTTARDLFQQAQFHQRIKYSTGMQSLAKFIIQNQFFKLGETYQFND